MRFGAGDETGEGGEGRYLAKTDFEFEEYVDLWSYGYEKNFLFFFCAQNKLYQNVGPSQVKRGKAELW